LHSINVPIDAKYKLTSDYSFNINYCIPHIINHIKPHNTKKHTIILIPKHEKWINIPQTCNNILYFDDTLSFDDEYLLYRYLYSSVDIDTKLPYYRREQISRIKYSDEEMPYEFQIIVIHTDNPSLYTAACFTPETKTFYIRIL